MYLFNIIDLIIFPNPVYPQGQKSPNVKLKDQIHRERKSKYESKNLKRSESCWAEPVRRTLGVGLGAEHLYICSIQYLEMWGFVAIYAENSSSCRVVKRTAESVVSEFQDSRYQVYCNHGLRPSRYYTGIMSWNYADCQLCTFLLSPLIPRAILSKSEVLPWEDLLWHTQHGNRITNFKELLSLRNVGQSVLE
jgi:hypothetical protein